MKIKNKSDKISTERKAELLVSSSATETKNFDDVSAGSIRMSYAQSGQSRMTDVFMPDKSVKEVLYPSANAMGCSFNTSLLREMGKAVGEDLRSEDINAAVISGCNIKRDPSIDRNAYLYSEDPYHAMRMCESYAQGLKMRGIEVILDGYGVDNSPDNRYKNNIVDSRAWEELYEKGFINIIRRIKPVGLIAPYAKINGVKFTEDEETVESFRRKSGFAGVVFAPPGSGTDPVKAINAGVLPEAATNEKTVVAEILRAVNEEILSEEKISSLVNRMGTVLRKIHANSRIRYMHDIQVNSVFATVAAKECFVLLKNEENVLPLSVNEKIYVIGKNAVEPFMQIKGRYAVSSVNPVSFVDAAAKYCECEYLGDHGAVDTGSTFDKDTFIVFAGGDRNTDQFGRTFRIAPSQKETLKILHERGKKVIAVITGANCPEIDFSEYADAIIYDPLCGEGAYEALSEIIFGITAPSGRLNQAVAVLWEDYPCSKYTEGDNVKYMESVLNGYRYFTLGAKKSAFPFGHGLTYSSFEYSSERCSYLKPDGNIDLAFDLTNTGDREAKEVVQVYVSDLGKRTFRPGRELKYFEKISLAPGQTERVNVRLNVNDFMHYDTEKGEYCLYSAKYAIQIGASADDIRINIPVTILADEKYEEHFSEKELPSYYPEEGRRLTVANNEYLMICPHANITAENTKNEMTVLQAMNSDKQAEKMISTLFEEMGLWPPKKIKDKDFVFEPDEYAGIRKQLLESMTVTNFGRYFGHRLQRPKKLTEITALLLGGDR